MRRSWRSLKLIHFGITVATAFLWLGACAETHAANEGLPRIIRDSGTLRYASRILAVGFPDKWRSTGELLNCLGEDVIDFKPSLNTGTMLEDTKDYDAILLCSGTYTYDQLKALSEGRQLIVHLPVYAAACGNLDVSKRQVPSDAAIRPEPLQRFYADVKRGTCRLVENAWFMKGYKTGDQFDLLWKNEATVTDASHVTPVIETPEGRTIVAQDSYPDGRITVMDFGLISGEKWTFPDDQDMVFQWIFEAAGCDQVDLGFYAGQWWDYEQLIGRVEKLVEAYGSGASIEDLPHASRGGKTMKLASFSAGPDKPIAYVECGIHAIEPTGCYGIYGYLSWLLQASRSGDVWARTVLDNLEIQWLPVVDATGYDECWTAENIPKLPVLPINLNRNFGPADVWKAVDYPLKGSAPFSAPEIQNIQWAVERNLPRIKVFADYHNCTLSKVKAWDGMCFGTYPITVHGPQYAQYAERTYQAFNKRYCYRDFGTDGLSDTFYRQISSRKIPQYRDDEPMAHLYGHSLGIPLAMSVEVWGWHDIFPYQQVGQFDAAATAFEQALAFELGATFFNSRSKPQTYECEFPHLNPTDRLTLYLLGRDQTVKKTETITAADKIKMTLEPFERLIVLKEQYKLSAP